MSRPTLIQNERLRMAVLTAIMAVVFACSMLVAWTMSAGADVPTVKSAVDLGQLTVEVPGDWTQRSPSPPAPGFVPQSVIADPADPRRALFVGGVNLRVPQSPVVVMQYTLKRLVRPAAQGVLREQRIEPFRLGDLSGARMVAFDRFGGQVQHHQLAVLSRDGRNHWVMYLSSFHDADEAGMASAARDAALFESMLSSAKLRPPASP